MNTDYRAARIQGERNEKSGDQNVFSVLFKVLCKMRPHCIYENKINLNITLEFVILKIDLGTATLCCFLLIKDIEENMHLL